MMGVIKQAQGFDPNLVLGKLTPEPGPLFLCLQDHTLFPVTLLVRRLSGTEQHANFMAVPKDKKQT